MTQQSASYTGVPSKTYNILPLKGDHRSMVKFGSMVDPGYQSVEGRIKEFIRDISGMSKSVLRVRGKCSLILMLLNLIFPWFRVHVLFHSSVL